jgi:hypothetical protein
MIHDLEEENPEVGVLFDTSKVEQQKEMDMVMVVKPNRYAHAEKGLKVRDTKILSGGGTGVRLKVNIKERYGVHLNFALFFRSLACTSSFSIICCFRLFFC